MPRGRKIKTLSLDEQLAKITEEIETMENSLKELKKTKKELEEQIKQEKLSELNDLITEKGLSFEEVKSILNKEE